MGTARQEMIDIFTYPANIAKREPNQRVVLGDVHGNVMKLIAFLIKENIILNEVDAYQSEYQELVKLYVKCFTERMKREDLQRFDSIITHFGLTAFTPKSSVLIIGDDLADRGGSDIAILMAYHRLTVLNVDYNILASNHGLDFLMQYYSEGGLAGKAVSKYMLVAREGFPESYFGRSLKALREHINGIDEEKANMSTLERLQLGEQEDNLGKEDVLKELNQLVQRHYIKHLKLISYDFKDDGIILYSHAPKHPMEINELFDALRDALDEPYDWFYADTPRMLAESIEKMNKWFQKVLERPEVFKAMMAGDKPLVRFINTRYEHLNAYEKSQFSEVGLFGNFPITNVHGHVGEPAVYRGHTPNWRYINLDTHLGQMMPDGDQANVGVYATFVADINTVDHSNDCSYEARSHTNGQDNNCDTDSDDTEIDEPPPTARVDEIDHDGHDNRLKRGAFWEREPSGAGNETHGIGRVPPSSHKADKKGPT